MGAATRARSRLAGYLALAAAAAGVALAGTARAYAGPPGARPDGIAAASAAPARRQVAAALGVSVLLPEAAAWAGDRDKASMVFGVRRVKMPIMIKTYARLKADGKITDEFV